MVLEINSTPRKGQDNPLKYVNFVSENRNEFSLCCETGLIFFEKSDEDDRNRKIEEYFMFENSKQNVS